MSCAEQWILEHSTVTTATASRGMRPVGQAWPISGHEMGLNIANEVLSVAAYCMALIHGAIAKNWFCRPKCFNDL